MSRRCRSIRHVYERARPVPFPRSAARERPSWPSKRPSNAIKRAKTRKLAPARRLSPTREALLANSYRVGQADLLQQVVTKLKVARGADISRVWDVDAENVLHHCQELLNEIVLYKGIIPCAVHSNSKVLNYLQLQNTPKATMCGHFTGPSKQNAHPFKRSHPFKSN